MFNGSDADTYHVGRYPNDVSVCLPVLVPWQRRQLSYWFWAGEIVLIPSPATIPFTAFWELRICGGAPNALPTCCAPCGLWQSTQVECRLLFSSVGSAASCVLLPAGKGCAILENSA